MERHVYVEVVASGKMDDYKAWFEARDKCFQRLGIPSWTMYEVQGRTNNMVCIILPEMEPGDMNEWQARYVADEEAMRVHIEMRE